MEQNPVRSWAWQVEGPLTRLDADFLQLRVWITCCPKKHCQEKGPYWLELAHSPKWSKAPQRQFIQFITALWFMHSSPFGQKLGFLLLLLTKVRMPAKMPGGREMQTPATLNEALEGAHSVFLSWVLSSFLRWVLVLSKQEHCGIADTSLKKLLLIQEIISNYV